mgnify:CR=1 FL=1
MVIVTTHSHLTNKSRTHDAKIVALWIDVHTHDEPQLITTIPLIAPLSFERVNRVYEDPNDVLNIHIV